jgi:hypothetical protein
MTARKKRPRTYAAQFEALKRCRTNGVQTVKVQHVTVNDGLCACAQLRAREHAQGADLLGV